MTNNSQVKVFRRPTYKLPVAGLPVTRYYLEIQATRGHVCAGKTRFRFSGAIAEAGKKLKAVAAVYRL
jgi:hypothetical protein